MKKAILVILIGLFSFQSFGQDPDFFQTWYLTLFYSDGDPNDYISEINPPISPYLTVTETLTFSGQGACNTFSGSFSYLDGVFTVETFTSTNITCDDQSHIDFEDRFFNNLSEGYEYFTNINDGNFDIQYLNLGSPLMFGMKFSNIPFPVPNLIDNWYLWSINYDSGDILDISTIDPPISPILTIYPDLNMEGFGDCNSFGGDFVYDAVNETLTTINYFETLEICEGESIEGEYFAFFSNEDELSYHFHVFSQDILFISSSVFNYDLVFNKDPLLSVPSFDKMNVILYPNPTSDRLLISSENIMIERFTVYSITGKKVFDVINESNSIDVSSLSKGIYFIEMSTSEGKSIKKFIKK